MKSDKTLVFYSGYYQSTFEFNEIVYLSSVFSKVIVVTVYDSDLEFPSNVEICKLNIQEYRTREFITLRKSVIISRILIEDLFFRKFNLKYVKKTKGRASRLLRTYYLSEVLDAWLQNKICYQDAIFYSFWMDDGATVFSIFSKQKKISSYYSRVHGSDLYDENPYETNPFRKLQLRYCKSVFSVSKRGEKYLKEKFPEFSSKIHCIYLGSFDVGISRLFNDAVFTIVSCAYIVDLKRLHLIADILKHIPFNVRWIHLGDDYNGLIKSSAKEILLQKAADLKKYKNIIVDFKGDVSSLELAKIYTENSINLFISVSETEGLPVSMMEAISAGIPVFSTNVGGCPEIVNENTGVLISKDFKIEEASGIICNFKNSFRNTAEYRRGVRLFWENNFDAKKNYAQLVGFFMRN